MHIGYKGLTISEPKGVSDSARFDTCEQLLMIVFHYHNYLFVAMRLFVKWGVPKPAGTPCEKFAYIWSMKLT